MNNVKDDGGKALDAGYLREPGIISKKKRHVRVRCSCGVEARITSMVANADKGALTTAQGDEYRKSIVVEAGVDIGIDY